MEKIYYPNLLNNQNKVAKPNVVWVADITSFELAENKKVYVYFCIDIFNNRIITAAFRNRTIKTADITSKMNEAIYERLPIVPRVPVILHSDRGTQFASASYNNFVKQHEGYIVASMSRANSPKDNSVAERFMRTFKEHRIDGRTFQEEIFRQIEINSKFRGYRKVFNEYIQSINIKPNKKSNRKPPQTHDIEASTATMLMLEPVHSKAFSERFGEDERRTSIEKFKSDTEDVISILDEIAAKRAEIVEKTPFDLYEDSLALKVIDQRLQGIYALIQNNPETTRQFVEDALLPIQDMLEVMDDKLNKLIPKRKTNKATLPLRDPLDSDLLPIYMAGAGSQAKYKQDLRSAQLQIAYTILFYAGLRVNEIRFFQLKDIEDAIKTSQFNVIHFKQKQAHIHVISGRAVQELKKLQNQLDVVFVKYKFKYLFGKDTPVDNKYLIKMINNDLKHTSDINQIPFNVKSHSFRINMLTKLLKSTSVQNAADIIGHKDIKSTMAYKRYALNKTEIKNLLDKIDNQ